MDEQKFSLADYHDILDAAFPAATMPEDVYQATHRKFLTFVRTEKLSVSEAISFLKDESLVQNFMSEAEKAVFPTQPQSTVVEVTKAISKLCADIDFIKNTVVNFTELGQNTKGLMEGIERSVAETNASTADNKKSLDGIHNAAAQLQKALTEAADKTNIVVEQLETIPPRLDAQLQRIETLEKGVLDTATGINDTHSEVKVVKGQTSPESTRKENMRVLKLSVLWGTIASTLVGTAVTAVLSHYSGKEDQKCTNTETRIETKTIEKETCPATFWTLKDKTGKRVYTLEASPVQGQTKMVAPASQRKTITPTKKKIKVAGSAPL